MKHYLPLFIFFVWLSSFNLAQAQDFEVDEDYISEFIYGINLNTNGGLIGGIMFKSTKIIKPKVYRSLGLEIVGVKNRKEIRVQSVRTGNTFIPGKINYLYSFRPQYGRDYILFRKAPEEGVQVSANFAVGPSIGLLVPYHILYNFGANEGARSEQYDPAVHNIGTEILGTGGFLDGLGDSEFLFGGHVKAGISLDFGAFRNSITGIEAGFYLEVFNRKADILDVPPGGDPELEVPNRSAFPGAYINVFFGSRK